MEDGVSVPMRCGTSKSVARCSSARRSRSIGAWSLASTSRDNDLEVNPLKGKKLTNVRASGTDEAVRLTPPVRMSLEEAIAYIDDDELVEVTPKSIRLRKRHLDPHERKAASSCRCIFFRTTGFRKPKVC